MSNDLVKRLRKLAKSQDDYAPYDCENDSAELTEAADCIDELLEALENAMGKMDTPIGRRKLGIDASETWLSEARAAIAKAKGEAG